MVETLDRITKGEGEQEDLTRLQTLAEAVKRGALCGLGPCWSAACYGHREVEVRSRRVLLRAGKARPPLTPLGAIGVNRRSPGGAD